MESAQPDEPGGSRDTVQPDLSGVAATNAATLCDLCLHDLIIDDRRAGGTVAEEGSSEGETPALDLSKFAIRQWSYARSEGSSRPCGRNESGSRDSSGWKLYYCGSGGPWWYDRELRAGGDRKRRATPPTLPELSTSTGSRCPFCKRLDELFHEEYSKCRWWSSRQSVLRFYIQYEWRQTHEFTPAKKTQDKEETYEEEEAYEDETDEEKTYGEETAKGHVYERTKPAEDAEETMREELACLAVIVHHPGLKKGQADAYEFDVGALPGKCRDWLKITQNPLDTNGPASEQNIQFMKRCIDECVNNHRNCTDKRLIPQFVPTRLLDIGGGENSNARLVESSQIPRKEDFGQLKYATLSYCWGKSLPLKTTEKTKDDHEKKGIPVHKMPQVFQDAIQVVSKLGIRYLWIDALCIIQENQADWEAESVSMSKTFAHSHITICAASSSSCSQSFLQRSNEQLILPFRSTLRPEISGEYSVLLTGMSISRHNADLRHSKWRRRGWVWQEEIMSPRKALFTERILQFRCNSLCRLESGYSISDVSIELDSNTDLRNFWARSIPSYSSRELTYRRDKLSAVSGVAKYIEDSLRKKGDPTKYLAGLWLSEYFNRELLWRPSEPTLSYRKMMESLQDKDTCAPSWSWASRDTGIIHYGGGYFDSFQVIDYDLQPAYLDAMISVKLGSSITLYGKCRKTPVRPSSGSLKTKDIIYKNGRHPRWETHIRHGLIRFWLDWMPTVEDPEENEIQSQLWLFFLGREYYETSRNATASGLLLMPFDGPDGTLYRRVGMFEYAGVGARLKRIHRRIVTIV